MSIREKLSPSRLEEKNGVTVSVTHEPEELTAEEKELHARTMSAVDRVLRSHGVSLTGTELHHVSAELADFVAEEVNKASGTAEEEETEESEGEESEGKPRRKAKKAR